MLAAIDAASPVSGTTDSVRDSARRGWFLAPASYALLGLSLIFAILSQTASHYTNLEQEKQNNEFQSGIKSLNNQVNFFQNQYKNSGHRVLTTEQNRILLNGFSTFTKRDICFVYIGKPEPAFFAQQIGHLLKAGGIPFKPQGVGQIIPEPVGIEISGPENDGANYFELFKSAGLNPTIGTSSIVCDPNKTSIVIGVSGD